MTTLAPTKEIANQLERECPGCVIESDDKTIIIKPESLLTAARFLKNSPELEFDYLNYVTAVDNKTYFLVVYNLVSLKNNVSLMLKIRCDDHGNPSVPSLVELWKGAALQEREVFDLMGIRFEKHPNMKRIFLWDGFTGHPLRKDFTS
jgi:NADH-quinone oxidoreductase subunit C